MKHRAFHLLAFLLLALEAAAQAATTTYAATTVGPYKSTDGGDNWFSVSDGLEKTLVFGLDQDPRRPGLLFVAGPGGIFKTTTGGE